MRKIPPETDRPVPKPLDLVLGGLSAAANDDAPAPVAPAESPEEAEDLLDDLLVVLFGLPADAWSTLAAAVPGELAERLSLYLDDGSPNRCSFRADPGKSRAAAAGGGFPVPRPAYQSRRA